MLRVVTLVLGLLMAAGAFHATPAQAQQQDDEARALFEAGRLAYGRGDYARALEHFSEAYELSDRPVLLFNVANCYDRLRRDREALEAFRKFISLAPDHPEVGTAQTRIDFLEKQVEEADATATPYPDPVPPTPEEAARTEADSTPAPVAETETRNGEPVSFTKEWWFWTAIGVVAVGAAVGIAVGVSGGDETRTADPVLYNDDTVGIRL